MSQNDQDAVKHSPREAAETAPAQQTTNTPTPQEQSESITKRKVKYLASGEIRIEELESGWRNSDTFVFSKDRYSLHDGRR